jgi:hypothetical protein
MRTAGRQRRSHAGTPVSSQSRPALPPGKELLRPAKADQGDARGEIRAVSDQLTLAAAQLAVARRYGFASWPRLKEAVEAQNLDLEEKVQASSERAPPPASPLR